MVSQNRKHREPSGCACPIPGPDLEEKEMGWDQLSVTKQVGGGRVGGHRCGEARTREEGAPGAQEDMAMDS